MTRTPRTDALGLTCDRDCGYSAVELCGTLEIENAELREALQWVLDNGTHTIYPDGVKKARALLAKFNDQPPTA